MDQDKLANLLEATLQALQTSQQLNLQLVAQFGPGVQHAELAPVATPAAPVRLLRDWLVLHDAHLAEKSYKPQTLKNRRAVLKHVHQLWGDRPITGLKPHDVASGLKRFGADRSSTAGRVLAELRDAYSEAVANGWAETNPAAFIKRPAHKVKRARLSFDTWQRMCTLAQAGPQRWVEPMLLLALITGQRRADLAKARFDDIVCDDAGARYLRIEQQKQAGKGYGARIELPLSLRLDAVGLSLADVIDRCMQSAKPGPTLLRKSGGGAIEESSLSARFHELIVTVLGEAAHKLHEWPSLHEVRSLSARSFRAEGWDVQTLLGHKHAEMTAIYEDDRGLNAHVWKRLESPRQASTASTTSTQRTTNV